MWCTLTDIMDKQDELPGTFHLQLNASVTCDYEDIEYFVKEYSCDPQMAHYRLEPARELLITTVKSYLPRKKETIKNSLEQLYKRNPTNINVVANLAHLYNSLLLTKKFEQLQSRLTEMLADQSAIGSVERARAFAERGFVLIGDIASQETSDDVDKLKKAIQWFHRAIEDGENHNMDAEEILIWTFYLAKSRFRLENRYRGENYMYKEDEDERKHNFTAMLDCFGRVYLSSDGKPEIAVYRAMSLVYAAETFSKTRTYGLKGIPPLYLEYDELKEYHENPEKGCVRAVELCDCCAVRNRFARVLMNQGAFQGAPKFQRALGEVKMSLKLNADTNWFGYCTRLQIYKNFYLSESRRKNVCMNLLKEALEEVDGCPYRSASTLLDIADIHYYLGVDPSTEKPEDPAELEKAVEYVMLARERVEGYKNARAHARLAHCLWALGSRRAAIECMKRAVELEKPGYKKNIQLLCKYLLGNYRDSSAEETRSKLAVETAAVFATGQQKLGQKELLQLLPSDDSSRDVLSQILQRMFYKKEYEQLAAEVFKGLFGCTMTLESNEHFPDAQKNYIWQQPKNCQSPGFQYDFFIVCAEEDYSLAFNILEELESRQCEGYATYKGLLEHWHDVTWLAD